MFFTILIFFAVLSLLVFVHELGHFVVARRFGVKAEEFGFGFPPRAFGFYKSKDGKWKRVVGGKEVTDAADTIYSVNYIPMGGFVKIKGELGPSDGSVLGQTDIKKDEGDSFFSKKIWQRVLIISAGVLMNVVLAAALLSVGYMIGLPQVVEGEVSRRAIVSENKLQVADVLPGSPAESAGLKTGDTIISISGQAFKKYEDLQNFTSSQLNKPLQYKIQRGTEIIDKQITPQIIADTGKPGIGIAIAETAFVKYPWYDAIWQGIKTTFALIWLIIYSFYALIKSMVMGQGVSGELAGPVGIAVLTGQVARMGVVYLLQFTAMLSLNLAVINFLPIPALDGGRVIFLLIERVKGSPVKRELEAIIHNVGFILLMLLVLVITFRDVSKFKDSFIHLFQRIIG